MRTITAARAIAAGVVVLLVPVSAGAVPITPGGSTEVTVGSNDSCSRRTSRTSRAWPSTRSTPRSSPREPTTTSTWRRATPAMTAPARSPRAWACPASSSRPTPGARGRNRRTPASRRATRALPRAPDLAPGHAPAGDTGCVPDPDGPIGTLPNYDDNGMVSNGDPELVFGPVPGRRRGTSPGTTASACTTRTSPRNFPGNPGFAGDAAIAVSRTDDLAGAIAGDNDAWMDPVS